MTAATLPLQMVGAMPMPVFFPYKETFLHGRPLHRKYDDFWVRHPPMDRGHRAKIFAPFDALRGFDFCLLAKEVLYTGHIELSDSQKEELNRRLTCLQALITRSKSTGCPLPAAEVTYFEPCTDPEHFAYGKGGQYRTITGTVSKIDPLIEKAIILDGQAVSLDAIGGLRIPGHSAP